MNPLYDSTAISSPALQEVKELWRYRDLLRLLVQNSIKTRYKRSSLGVAWTLLNPLLNTLVLTIAFSQLLRFQVQSYPIYLLVGLLTWNFFAQTTNQAMHTLVWGGSLIKRIYVPRTIFAVAVLGNGLINYLLALIPLTVIMLVLSHPFRPSLLLLPLALLILATFTLGAALLLSTLAVMFVDVVDMYTVFLTAWFYLTPVIYPLEIVPDAYARWIAWNPLAIMVQLFRAIIYEGRAPSPVEFLVATGLAVVSFIAGWWYYTRKADEFAYRI